MIKAKTVGFIDFRLNIRYNICKAFENVGCSLGRSGIAGRKEKNEFDVAMIKTMEMCNLSQGMVDRTLVNAIISMMTNLKLSAEFI